MCDGKTKGEELFRNYNLLILEYNFEILSEEDEEIDIDSIEEFEFGETEEQTNYENRTKINQLIKAVKQLNKKMEEK